MDSWDKLSMLLLERKHIKLPIERRFFLSFLENDTDTIKISNVLNKIETMGFLKDDPRLLSIRKKFKALIPSNTMKYEEFKYCIDNHINILSKILKHELIIPNFNSFTERIKTIYELTKKNNVGNVFPPLQNHSNTTDA